MKNIGTAFLLSAYDTLYTSLNRTKKDTSQKARVFYHNLYD
ncbi:hypothetical protein GYO_2324 [Bacillus spizizenii TU-B-10]|uniref:Uncharacterized protein n=1 Tax=Bacillus spizizenii (strain DSM 15029 / JCM 12233 / NBRC 101239 / NRRL B-23049 / TU-B-10) TaxID=1052585 RepID=G4NQ17_BACS4|nr:hypothetical protein GYO_2324 [Bacillus spizizenii TU-B-10]SCV41689.1 hypothetical protein BQ1740_2631 [Bacillus subtilis]